MKTLPFYRVLRRTDELPFLVSCSWIMEAVKRRSQEPFCLHSSIIINYGLKTRRQSQSLAWKNYQDNEKPIKQKKKEKKVWKKRKEKKNKNKKKKAGKSFLNGAKMGKMAKNRLVTKAHRQILAQTRLVLLSPISVSVSASVSFSVSASLSVSTSFSVCFCLFILFCLSNVYLSFVSVLLSPI